MDLANRILGCLVGAAAGDALGSATEMRTIRQIKEYFGGYVTDFLKPPHDTFCCNNEAGMVTDDFRQGYFLLESVLDQRGFTYEAAKDAMFKWYKCPYYPFLTGPTTKAFLIRMFEPESLPKEQAVFVNDGNSKATNGGAMRIFPAGILNPKNIDHAVKDAYEVTKLTHPNSLALSGACAIAASIAEACNENSSIDDILAAGHKGAVMGFERAENEGLFVAGASVARRIELAIELGKKHKDWKTVIYDLADYLGAGLHVSDSIPTVYGLIAACPNDPLGAIFGGVNVGNDTDTIATMVGAIVGAKYGIQSFPSHYQGFLEKQNNMDFTLITKQALQYIESK